MLLLSGGRNPTDPGRESLTDNIVVLFLKWFGELQTTGFGKYYKIATRQGCMYCTYTETRTRHECPKFQPHVSSNVSVKTASYE